MMKKFIIQNSKPVQRSFSVVGFIIISLAIYGCVDAIDADNPLKNPINPIEPKQTLTKFKVNDIKWDFMETYVYSNSGINESWNGQVKFNRNEVWVDTSTVQPALWIDMDVENTMPDDFIRMRSERITSFRLKIDSLLIDGFYNLGSNSIYGGSAELRIKSININQSKTLTDKDVNIGISLYGNGNNGLVECQVFANFDREISSELLNFTAFLDIKYK